MQVEMKKLKHSLSVCYDTSSQGWAIVSTPAHKHYPVSQKSTNTSNQ